MVLTISKRICVRNVQFMLLMGLMWLVPLGAGAQSLPNIDVCNDCSSDLQFSQAAFSATDLFPGQSEDVYVVNVTNEQTRVFRVTLIITGSFGDTSLDISITEISGDPAVLGDIATATTTFRNFNDALIQDIDAEDLDLSFDSALDLIDAGGSSASGLRRELQEELTDYYSCFWRSMITDVTDTIDSLLDKFLAESGLDAEYDIVVFEDGTKVRLKIEEVGRVASDPLTIIIEFDVDLESITAPGLNFVAVEPDFSRFSASDLDYDLAQELRDLAFLFGIPVVGADDVQECRSSWSCGVDRCTVTVSC